MSHTALFQGVHVPYRAAQAFRDRSDGELWSPSKPGTPTDHLTFARRQRRQVYVELAHLSAKDASFGDL
jgi:hypothetical protein